MEEVKCAIYTRKSTDEGLEKEFNTLEAQREAGENYIKSQKHQGWVLVEEHYDDGGFSGGNMKRPALQRLLDDIKCGKINMIVVYKIDRLTRSLVDFSKMVDIFDKYHCSFVSVTQNFNTSDSMGRLTLNMLLSFAQFEREIGSERVRDKTAASRKKGMWTGGVVPYGYRSINKKLEIEPQEADVVKFMFEMYLKYKSVMSVCKLLTENGYRDFRRDALLRMLKNPTYMGKIKYKDELYDGQHKAIISPKIFESVQYILKNKEKSERTCLFNKNEVGILRGLLTCGCCHSPMTPASCQSHGVRRFYYTSTKAKYYGYHHCSNGAVPVQLMDECILKIVTPLISDITVLNGLINKISTDKAVSPTVEMAKRNSRQRIDPLIEDCPALKGIVSSPRSRDKGNTMLSKDFQGGVLVMTGANSAVGLRSMPARYLFMDEIDGYPQDIDGEGDPILLAERRTATFSKRKKIFLVSTPTIKGLSNIEREFENSDKRYYFVPCPYCGGFQKLEWAQIRAEDGNVAYECVHCGKLIGEHYKTQMLANGHWQATTPSDGLTAGYHLSSLYSPVGWLSWKECVDIFEKTKTNPSLTQGFRNTILGETYEAESDAPEWQRLYEKRETYILFVFKN